MTETTSIDDAFSETTLTAGSVQRATLYVPTYESIVSLGAAYRPTEGTVTQHGFSATSNRNVFMRADGAVTFQADGQAWFQSDHESLYLVSGKSSYLVAGQDLYLGSGAYLGIMAGYASVPVKAESPTHEDGNPKKPAAVDGIHDGFVAADIIWEVFDQLVLTATALKTIERKVYFGEYSAFTKMTLAATISGRLYGLSSYIYGEIVGADERSLNFFSEAGFLMGTPAFASLYGGIGLTCRSANNSILGLVGATVASLGGLTFDSLFGETSVRSATSFRGISSSETALYSTLGSLELYGADIQIGGKSDPQQFPTTQLNFHALKSIELTASAPSLATITWECLGIGGALDIQALTSAEWESGKTTTIDVGGVYKIEASPTSVTIKNAMGEVVSLMPGMITLGPAAGQIKIGPSMIDAGSGSVLVTPAMIQTMVGSVDLL